MNDLKYTIKELELSDLEEYSGFFETLSNLRKVGNLSLEQSKVILKKNQYSKWSCICSN